VLGDKAGVKQKYDQGCAWANQQSLLADRRSETKSVINSNTKLFEKAQANFTKRQHIMLKE
jgi:hypothetical protein